MTALDEVKAELDEATEKFGLMASAHEGIAVIREEYLELEQEVFWGSPEKSKKEAIQLAATAIRFLHDVHGVPL